ncbi:hypothetical protein ABEV41_19265 [Geobacillus thermodenitrificans]|jgi:hypothetical protein|uniref:hypothetical protein n=1 Tax=Geobacillus thermodenitrificans TaxID=33940 RepID=UPI003D24CFE8
MLRENSSSQSKGKKEDPQKGTEAAAIGAVSYGDSVDSAQRGVLCVLHEYYTTRAVNPLTGKQSILMYVENC